MVKRMLIDAAHPEETRVVVISGNRLEEFDFESATKKRLKGNIYLAKVVRVEPSLQAAFVEYGGNRHGFLAFNEIHPDYYRVPVADQKATSAAEAALEEGGETQGLADRGDGSEPDGGPQMPGEAGQGDGAEGGVEDGGVETVGGDEGEEIRRQRLNLARDYKIQEVIKRRQILLVQIAKEERGTKGAALTTYVSLAGRHCVLMPNTNRGGGISRRISDPKDRKRLKTILENLDIPEGMAVILRTAVQERSKAEIKRDYEYLVRLWNEIRERTLKSTAPSLIHEEANLIKRSIRDLYRRDIDEILVEGQEGYRIAKEFMRTTIPSHATRVQPYRDTSIPLFPRYQVEDQIDNIRNPTIHLKSGGYIVINPTEALVAIDVNSGRATKGRNIEETAYKTNLEAAEEIARQLRLRDLAGLIVIDFIDMEDRRNNQSVERRLKEAMKSDRARIQLGRISPFGLLELSRQRLRPSLAEASTRPCTHCGGTGFVRSTESTALHVLRAIEEEGTHKRSSKITVSMPTSVALYILNQKREVLREIERRCGFTVFIARDDSLIPPDFRLERVKALGPEQEKAAPVRPDSLESETEEKAVEHAAAPEEAGKAVEEKPAAPAGEPAAAGEAGEPARKRRRRGKRGGRRRSRRQPATPGTGAEAAAAGEAGAASASGTGAEAADDAVTETPADQTAEDPSQREAPKKKPTRRRRRFAPAAREARETTAAERAKTPGRTRSRRRKREGCTEAAKVSAGPVPGAAAPEPSGSLAGTAVATTAKSSLVPAEPGNGGSHESPAKDTGEKAADGSRKGWWQRLRE
jgi:ribonuclease E